MRPIDAHVHVGKWNLPDFTGHGSTFLETTRTYQRWNWAGAVVFTTDSGDNAHLLEACRSFSGSALFRCGFWADTTPDNLAAYQQQAGDYALLKIHPSITRRPATDPQFAPYGEIAAARGQPVVIHCGRWQEMAGYTLALEFADRFPKAPVILAHMGGDSPHLVQAAVDAAYSRKMDNVYFGTESIREPWLLESAIRRIGASRLIFGSDFNLNHPEPFRRLIEILDVTDEERTMILRSNINNLMSEQQRFF